VFLQQTCITGSEGEEALVHRWVSVRLRLCADGDGLSCRKPGQRLVKIPRCCPHRATVLWEQLRGQMHEVLSW
jgi:hypothetical protein